MVETKKTTTGESRHQYCYSCVIKYPDQNDRYAAVINRIDDQIAEKDREIKALGRQQACLSFAWVAWAILIAYLLFAGCSPSTSSPTSPEPGTEEPVEPLPPQPPPPPPPPDLFNITLNGMDDLPFLPWQKEAISRAKHRWERVITEGLPDIKTSGVSALGLPWSDYPDTIEVDDIVVHITWGGESTVAIADTRSRSHTGRRGRIQLVLAEITIYAGMLDAEFNFSLKDWEMILLHEFGHALGINTQIMHALAGIDTINAAPYFRGQRAATEYLDILNLVGRQPAMSGLFVPMSDDSGGGHWKSPDLIWDVMNPYAAFSLTAVTLGAMIDLGYKVDMSLAETPDISLATKLAVPRFVCDGTQIHIITP